MKDVLDGVNLHPRSAAETLVALDTVARRFAARRDPRAVFPRVYAIITHGVADEVARTPSGFREPRWMSRLAGRFGERYLETLAWSLRAERQDCSAWDVAYRYAAAGATIPLQDVILGLSAHINYDLALGIAQTIAEHGHARDRHMLERYKHDHDHINVLLDRAIPESYARVAEDFGCRTTALLTSLSFPRVRWTTLKVLEVWRERVWRDVLDLLRADGDAPARTRVLARMERYSRGVGRAVALGSAVYLAGRPLLPEALRARTAQWLVRAEAERAGLDPALSAVLA
jgi:hypothetical protein